MARIQAPVGDSGLGLASRAMRSDLVAKLAKYSAASVAGTITDTIVFTLFYEGVFHWGWPANVLSVSIGAIPNYLINRYWTWAKRGPNQLMREIVPFWSMAFLGLLLSTAVVGYIDANDGGTFLAWAGKIASFGSLWVIRFVVLDRVLFKTEPEPTTELV
jgi:putative flippase GtrA